MPEGLLHDFIQGAVTALVILGLARIGWFPAIVFFAKSQKEYNNMRGEDED